MPDDYAADRFTAGTVAVGGSATGDIETAHDQDWFAVELVAGRTYRFDLGGSPSGGGTLRDTYLRAIYDSAGRYQPDSYNDDFGGSRDSRVTFTPTESGTYYVRASGDRNETGSYTLSVRDVTPPGTGQDQDTGQSVSEGDTDLPNDTSTPGRVAVGGAAMGAIGTAGDQDRFAVELEAGRTYQFDLTGSPGGGGTLPDTYFRAIYNSAGRYQPDSYNDDFGGSRDSRVTFTPTESGTYYVRASGDRNETGSYTLSVTDVTQQQAALVPGPPEPEPESAQGQSTPGAGQRANVSEPTGEDLPSDTSTPGEVDVGGSVTGNIDRVGDRDWFAVELEASKRYQIDLEGAPTSRGTLADPYLPGIYDADGNEIPNTSNDDAHEGNLNSRVIFTPAADGTYYVIAADFPGGVGTYTLSVRDVTPPPTPHLEGDTDLAGDATTTGVVEVDGLVARGAIAAPVSVSGNYYRFDYDWFKVDLQAGQTYRVDLAPVIDRRGDGTYEQSLYPEIVALYDADSDYLHHTSAQPGSGPGYVARVEFTPNADGAYYISVAGLGFTAGEYELTVSDAM